MMTREGQAEKDLALMRRVASGEEAAVGELYDRFGSLVYRMAFQVMPTRAEAEDAVQEIFIRLWRTAERYDPERAALVTWVMLISRRQLVDRMRRTRARNSLGQQESETQKASKSRPGWNRMNGWRPCSNASSNCLNCNGL